MVKKVEMLFLGAVMLFLSFATPVYAISAPDISAKGAVLYCPQTGRFLYEKNADDPLPPASTTKIVSALLACESGRLAQWIRVTPEMVNVEGSSMELAVNDLVTFRGLVCGMLLSSGNDAANAAAVALCGSTDVFVRQMNERAASLGLTHTHFRNPSGLPEEGHLSTARDLALLTAEALKNDAFSQVCAMRSASVSFGDPPCPHLLSNHNRLLGAYEGCIGVKTGFTNAAGRCLVTAAERDGLLLICVTLNDPDDWEDHKKLLDHGAALLPTCTVTPDASGIALRVTGSDTRSVAVRCVGDAKIAGEPSSIRTEYRLPPFVYAPVHAGDPVGSAVISRDGRTLAELPLVAAQDAPVSPPAQPEQTDPGREDREERKNIMERIAERIVSWLKK